MSIRLLTIQSSKSAWLSHAAEEYSEKINYFHKFELVNLRSAKKGREEALSKKKEESELILKAIKQDDFIIVFDEKGSALTSKQFSEMIQKTFNSGAKRINFIVGGAFGVEDTVLKRAQKTIKMSDFVLNHHIATLVALEQIYRAFTILKNKPYHNE